jgi:predicted HTH transcriptional regulator
MPNSTQANLAELVDQLRRLPRETEWVEFKQNQAQPDDIGEYVSALANSAVLADKPAAYIVWGIEDGSHGIVGTSFDPFTTRIGNELLEGWLNRLVEPRIAFSFNSCLVAHKPVVVLEIPRALAQPVRFKGEAYVRIGSYRKKLKDQPERERALWRSFDRAPFEGQTAAMCGEEDVLKLLDYPAYFDLLTRPLPEGRAGILDALEREGFIEANLSNAWNITNLGALLLARRLSDFPRLGRKAPRVIHYKGNNRIQTLKEQVGGKGYASGFDGMIQFINGLLPSHEVIGTAFRHLVSMYPELAIRELVANALIHQDLAVTGAGPMVEIFDTRLEITNPGIPLVEPTRFLDTPPRSRNETLAAMMRRFGICEERGSGIDKVVYQIEFFQLPAPVFEVAGEGTRVVLFAHKPLSRMDRNDRIRACYQHACLRYVTRDTMTNATVRQRFGIEDRNIAQASRLIREAVDAEQIVPYDAAAAPRHMRYIPWWARDPST